MKKIGQAIFKIIFWRFPRGSWQYDVFCLALILLTIFIKPYFLVNPKKNRIPIRILLSNSQPASPDKLINW